MKFFVIQRIKLISLTILFVLRLQLYSVHASSSSIVENIRRLQSSSTSRALDDEEQDSQFWEFVGNLLNRVDGDDDDAYDDDANDDVERTTWRDELDDYDWSELFSYLTIPHAWADLIQVHLLFLETFRPLLGFFGVPGYEEYVRSSEDEMRLSPFYSDPVPFASQCVFCEDAIIDKKRKFSGLTCGEWEIFAGFSQDQECSVLRAIAVHACGCMGTGWTDTLEMPTCHLCGSEEKDEKWQQQLKQLPKNDHDWLLPTMTGKLQCEDLHQLPAADGPGTCQDIAQFADWCGCPKEINDEPLEETDANANTTTPIDPNFECRLCPNGDAPQFADSQLIDGGNISCAEIDASYAASRHTEEACQTAYQQASFLLNLDLQEFCGCPFPDPPVFGEEQPEPQPSENTTSNSSNSNNRPSGSSKSEFCEPCLPGYKLRRPDASNMEQQQMQARAAGNVTTSATCADRGSRLQTLLAQDPLCWALQSQAMVGCCIVDNDNAYQETNDGNNTNLSDLAGTNLVEASLVTEVQSSSRATLSRKCSWASAVLVATALCLTTRWL